MIEKFIDFIRSNQPFDLKEPILLAVSGGVDSMVMSHFFYKAGLNFGIAHINFKLRGADSDEDELFVKALSEQQQVKFFHTQFDTEAFAREDRVSIQMAARELRYKWLEEVRKKEQYHFIATAHHRDDNVETVLLNLFRGTGIRGLHGIPMMQGKIVRPLLSFYKSELLDYAHIHHISFREDQSNATLEYDRNKIRLEIIPHIEKYYPAFRSTFAENIWKWKDAGSLYDREIAQLRKKLLEKKGDELFISINRLLQYPAAQTILYELLTPLGFTVEQAAQITVALKGTPGKIFYSPSYRLIKDRKLLVISKIGSGSSSEMLLDHDDRTINLGSLRLKIDIKTAVGFQVPRDSSITCLDYDNLEFPLLIRRWKKGDYFYPLGMKKKKKISDYLVDRKIPVHEKENLWLIESGKRVAAIIGERIDERFKVTPSTKNIWIAHLTK